TDGSKHSVIPGRLSNEAFERTSLAAKITAITDGSAPAMAVARWLKERGARATVLEARSPEDVVRIIRARQMNRTAERLVALSEIADGADLDGGPALRVAIGWLSHLPPIEQRGATLLLETQRRAEAKGHEHLD